ncbi:MAG TPA: PKD domain-containing protein, partial [Candidatus Lokiarchaeia archaeon]|nr:PKD domain-containing protein [Candidatus Lokiarchaeia archaeon]
VSQRVISVYAYVTPSFVSNATSVIVGQTVQFTDTTSGGKPPLAYQWNFGDGTGNSTLQNPAHQFAAAGTFTVTLTVTDANGDALVYQLTITVTSSSEQTQPNLTWVIIVIVIAGGAAVVVAGVVVSKKKAKARASPPEQ